MQNDESSSMRVHHTENDGNDQFSVIFRLTLSNSPALSPSLTLAGSYCVLFLQELAVSRLTLSIARDLSPALTVSANFLIIFYAFPREIDVYNRPVFALGTNLATNSPRILEEGFPEFSPRLQLE